MIAHRVFRNIFSNWALTFTRALVGLVLTPLLFHRLEPSNYAILILALAIAALLGALDLGLVTVLVWRVSHLDSRGMHDELKRLVSTAFYVVLGAGAIGVLGLSILSPLIARFFHLHGTASSRGELVICVVALGVVFQLPCAVLRSLLEGFHEFQRANSVEICGELLRGAAMVILLIAGFGLLPISIVFPIGGLLRLIGMLGMAHRTKISFWPRPADVNFSSLLEMRRFVLMTFVQDTIARVFSQTDNFLAAQLLPLPQLAVLAVARRFPSALARLSQQAIWVAHPLVSGAITREDHQAVKRFVLVSTRNLLGIALPCAVALAVWAEEILRLWVGPEVLSGAIVLRWLLVFAVFASLQEIPLTLIYGLGGIRYLTCISLSLLFAAVLLGGWGCVLEGLQGLALVLACLQSIATLLFYAKALRLTGISTRLWLVKSVLPPILAGLVALVWFPFSYRLLPRSLAGLVVSTTVGLPLSLCFFTLWVTKFRPQGWSACVRSALWETD